MVAQSSIFTKIYKNNCHKIFLDQIVRNASLTTLIIVSRNPSHKFFKNKSKQQLTKVVKDPQFRISYVLL